MYPPDNQTQIAVFQGQISVQDGTVTVAPLAGVTALLDPVLANGAIAQNGTLTALVVNGPGAVSLDTCATIGTVQVAGGGSFIPSGGGLTFNSVTVDAQGAISGRGIISGTDINYETITDNGTITASGGALELGNGIGGTGSLAIASQSTLRLDGTVAGGLPIAFQAGSNWSSW